MTDGADAESSDPGATVDAGAKPNASTDGGSAPSDGMAPFPPPTVGSAVKRRTDGAMSGKTWSPLATTTGPVRIGSKANGFGGFNGLIDRVRLYKIAISDEDMIAHASYRYEPCTASPECVGDWTFDNEQNGTYPSTGKIPLPAKLVGDAKISPGRDGKALEVLMNGTTARGWAEIPFDPALDLREEFSLEAWVLFTNDCGRSCAFYIIYDHSPALDFEVHGGGMVLRTEKGGPGAPSGASFPNGKRWTHVGITYNRYELRFFKDGKMTKALRP